MTNASGGPAAGPAPASDGRQRQPIEGCAPEAGAAADPGGAGGDRATRGSWDGAAVASAGGAEVVAAGPPVGKQPQVLLFWSPVPQGRKDTCVPTLWCGLQCPTPQHVEHMGSPSLRKLRIREP